MVAAQKSPSHASPPSLSPVVLAKKKLSDWQAAGQRRCSIRTVLISFLLCWLSYFQFKGTLCFNNDGGNNDNGMFMAMNHYRAVGSFETNEDAITAASVQAFYKGNGDVNDINNNSNRSGKSMMVHNYRAAPIEDYVMRHTQEMGYESTADPTGCTIWTDPKFVHYASLQQYLDELQSYTAWVETFPPIAEDLRDLIRMQQQQSSAALLLSSSSSSYAGGGGNAFDDAKRQVCARLLFNNNINTKTNDDHPADGVEGWFAQSRRRTIATANAAR
jgi:hypothetical protein